MNVTGNYSPASLLRILRQRQYLVCMNSLAAMRRRSLVYDTFTKRMHNCKVLINLDLL